MPVEVRSRAGNVILAVVGVVYLCTALGLLAYALMQTWGATTLIDEAIVVALIGCAIGGGFLAFIAARNLGSPLLRRSTPLHREGAATAP